MALFCSADIHRALEGAAFPATKQDLINYVKARDAYEAVIVGLDNLDDRMYQDISEVCVSALPAEGD